MTDLDTHELQDLAGESPTFADNRNPVPVQAWPTEIESALLPPTDHGKHAYLYLVGCTLIQAPVWGRLD